MTKEKLTALTISALEKTKNKYWAEEIDSLKKGNFYYKNGVLSNSTWSISYDNKNHIVVQGEGMSYWAATPGGFPPTYIINVQTGEQRCEVMGRPWR